LDNAKRFDDRKAVAKYGALTPTIYQSGGVTHMGHINRDGRHEVRKVLLQCAHTVARMKSYDSRPLRDFFERVMKKRGKKIAVVALARKLLTIAYGVLKSGNPYDPKMLLPVSSR
jgi:transposase